jgi:hypothetical protein
MNTSDKIKVVHLALSMLGVPVFIHLSYIKLYDNHVNSFSNTISSVSTDTRY